MDEQMIDIHFNETIENITKRLSDIENSLAAITATTEKLESLLPNYDVLEKISTALEQSVLDAKDSNIRVRDIQDRIYDIKGQIGDIQVRTHDIQNQTYNVKASTSDTQVRMRDIQDRTYDQLHLVDTYNVQDKMLLWSIFKKTEETHLEAKKRFFRSMPYDDKDKRLLQNATSLLLKEFDRIMKKNKIDYFISHGTLIGVVLHKGWIPWDDDIDVGMLRKDIPAAIDAVNKEDTYIQIKSYYSIIHQEVCNMFRVRFKDESIKLFVDIFIYDYCETDDYKAAWLNHRRFRKEYTDELLQYRPETRNDDSLDESEQKQVLNKEHISIIEQKTSEYNEKLNIKEQDASHIIWGIDNCGFYEGRFGIFKKDIIFPLNSESFEGCEYPCPNQTMDFLESMYGDIYKLPNDIITHKHIVQTDYLIEKCKEVLNLYGG